VNGEIDSYSRAHFILFLFHRIFDMEITARDVEHVIIPIAHEHLIILLPNIFIVILTFVLISFYIRQGIDIQRNIDSTSARLSNSSLTSSKSLSSFF